MPRVRDNAESKRGRSLAPAFDSLGPPAKAPTEAVDYSDMTKADLKGVAADKGVEVKSSWTKAKIIAALEE